MTDFEVPKKNGNSKNVETSIAATGEANGWEDVWAPSAVPFVEEKYPTPVAMGDKEIEELKKAWAEAVVRSDEAGFDVVELHLAHGEPLILIRQVS